MSFTHLTHSVPVSFVAMKVCSTMYTVSLVIPDEFYPPDTLCIGVVCCHDSLQSYVHSFTGHTRQSFTHLIHSVADSVICCHGNLQSYKVFHWSYQTSFTHLIYTVPDCVICCHDSLQSNVHSFNGHTRHVLPT